jgi:ParB family transcriptional regulator, chromosome partitioning protein
MAGATIGESDGWSWNPLRDHVAKTTARPEFAFIALISAGYEKQIQKDSWRSAGRVEQIIIDKAKPETIAETE